MPYEKIVAVGDSFTRGDELLDCPQQQILGSPLSFSHNTWPALIAKNLSIDYDCIAIGGRGNHWISWQVAAHIHNYKSVDSLFIINWSWLERFDYINIDNDEWLTTHPRHENKLDHYFYRNLDSDLWNVHRNRQQIHSTVALLKEHNIDFIMTCIDPLCHTNVWSKRSIEWTHGMSTLDISSHITTFDNMTFLEWSHMNNFKCGLNGHPLEDAHAEAAKYINTHVIEGKNNGHR